MKRLVLLLAASLAALALAVTGCGGDDSSTSEPAAVAPPSSPLFLEAALQPEGEVKSNVESLAENLAGIDDIGAFVVEKIEEEADSSGEPVDFEKEIEPWLGERAGMFVEAYDGDDFTGSGIAVETTDTDATQDLIDKQSVSEEGPAEDGSYEGVDFKVELDDEQAIGLIGDLLVFAEDEQTFKDAVDASKGEALSDVKAFSTALAGVPSNSFADVYVDVGGLIEQEGGSIDPQAQQFLETVGVDPTEMTATASLVPGSDQIELNLASDLGGATAPSGDASKLLGSLPASSLIAFASADFGDQLQEGIDSLDASGVPGEIPPHQLKSTLAAVGIDLDKISGSLEDSAVFVEGSSQRNIGGALVLTSSGDEAKETVANIGFFLRRANVPGVTALNGKVSGFSVRSEDLGRQPLVVATKDDRIVIAYGPAAAAKALGAGSRTTLSEVAAYKEAVSALDGTPISGFVDGPSALRLVESLIPADKKAGFAEARPYLRKAVFAAIGSGSSGSTATAKLIVGFGK